MSVTGLDAALVDAVDALLPQTQCRRCGYDACRPYAEALVAGETDLNRCPPGGERTIAGLSRLLGKPEKMLDEQCGRYVPRTVAVIDEHWCIGCTLCIRACPVDAIIGARRLMHTVVADDCSGCELCLAPCPVDCIRMAPAADDEAGGQSEQDWFAPWSVEQANRARAHHEAREQRLAARSTRLANRRRASREPPAEAAARQAEVLAAVQRVRARRPRGHRGDER